MTHAVLLFEEDDDSLVTHILRWRWGGQGDVGGRTQDKQTTYMDVNHKYTDSIPYAGQSRWGTSVRLRSRGDILAFPGPCDLGHIRQTGGTVYEMM